MDKGETKADLASEGMAANRSGRRESEVLPRSWDREHVPTGIDHAKGWLALSNSKEEREKNSLVTKIRVEARKTDRIAPSVRAKRGHHRGEKSDWARPKAGRAKLERWTTTKERAQKTAKDMHPCVGAVLKPKERCGNLVGKIRRRGAKRQGQTSITA